MVLRKKLSGLAVLAIITGAAVAMGTAVQSAPAGVQKRSVPASILKGSLVSRGRAFYRTSMFENSLAGIKLGRRGNEVLLRWGNPTRITVSSGSGQAATATKGAGPMMGAGMGMPGMGAGGPMMAGPMAGAGGPMMGGAAAGGMGAGGPMMAGPMAGAGGPMMGAGMGMGMGMGMGAAQAATQTTSVSANEVVWTYDLANGITLEFVVTDNYVTQITVGGTGPWAQSKTRMGIQLGDTYKLVMWVAGFPENQEYSGNFLRVTYANRSHIQFILQNKKVVGITIAQDPDSIH